jgi:hypothetical protein
MTRVRYCLGNVKHERAAEYGLRSLLETVIPPDCLVRGSTGDERREDEVVVTYGNGTANIESGVRVFESGFFDDRFGTIEAMPRRPVVRLESIPAMYRDEQEPTGRFYSVHNSSHGAWVDCHVDVVAGAFLMLSRYEETVVRSADRLARFRAESSIACQEGFLQEPVVNQYADRLFSMLRSAGFTGEKRMWWNGAPWAIALTHDVDRLHRFPMTVPDVARYVAGRVPVGTPGLRDLVHDYVQTSTHRKTDEYDCLLEMATWEAGIGVHSSYYFLGDSHGLHSADYAVDAPEVAASIQAIAGMGHEIGFHAGIRAFEDVDRFHRELSRVRSVGVPILGGRQHYLRWSTPATWRLWEAEGLAYDATLGYSKIAGFRCGTCLPFHPYDIENDREMSMWEWPLMFMDTTYLMSWPEGMTVLDCLAGECRRYGGVLVLLWHNTHWSATYASAVRNCFRGLIERSSAQAVVVESIRGLMRLSGMQEDGCPDGRPSIPV